MRGARVHKPRTILWEWLVLARESPLRKWLDANGGGALDFLPSLAFSRGAVSRVALDPLPRLSRAKKIELAEIVGRAIALFAFLGVGDLHWENLVLGRERDRIVFGPLDVEMIFADMASPTETRLLPDARTDDAAMLAHACGARRVLPYLGKPIDASCLLAIVSAYRATFAFLERHASDIARIVSRVRGLRTAPIRVTLRGTDEYVRARSEPVWPPLLDAESEQLMRGDIPYFFRLYGSPGIRYFADRALRTAKTIPRRGDVPTLAPLLSVARGFRSPSRARLREQGLFAIIAAFDAASLTGTHRNDALAITLSARAITVKLASGETMRSPRNLRAFVGSVYLPCGCGEVKTPLA
jgi:hypothetical protein